MKFQVVVANPPIGLAKWDDGFLADAGLSAKGKKQEKMTTSMDFWKLLKWGFLPAPRATMHLSYT